LLQAAIDQEQEAEYVRDPSKDRAVAARRSTKTNLNLLLGKDGIGPEAVLRGEEMPADVAAARPKLTTMAVDTLALISDRAAKTSQSALAGLLGLGLLQITSAAGIVGMDIARALGQAEKVTRLYSLFRSFAVQAYESLVALLGPSLAQAGAQRVLEWVEAVSEGEQVGQLLETLYNTHQTGEILTAEIAASQVGLERFHRAMESVLRLEKAYLQQTTLAEKILKGLRYFGGIPAATLPQGILLVSAAYLVLAAYIILTAADYVDSEKVTLLDRVPGVRRSVEMNLLLSQPGGDQ
jgi:hypothetical protein